MSRRWANVAEYLVWLLVAYMNAVAVFNGVRDGRSSYLLSFWVLAFFVCLGSAALAAKAARK